MARSPEIVQGLRNLVQNAVDFAATTVWIDLDWDEAELRLRIGDDGPGYPPELIGRIGDPFVRKRPAAGRAARLRRHGPRALHRQDAARAQRRARRLRATPPLKRRPRRTGRAARSSRVAWPRDRVSPDPAASRAA